MSRPLARGGAVAGWPLHMGRPLRFAALVVREAPGGMAWLCRADSGQAIALFEARIEAETWLRAWDAFVRRWHGRWQLGLETARLAEIKAATGAPRIDGARALPRGPARPALEVSTVVLDDFGPDEPPEVTEAWRRAEGRGMRALDDGQRAAVRRYAGLVERVSSIAGPGEGAVGAMSDGGAVTRCAIAEAIRACRDAMGHEPVDLGRSTHMDRAVAKPLTPVDLVHGVAVRGQAVADILRAHGWSAGWRKVDRATSALRAAADRLQAAFDDLGKNVVDRTGVRL